MKASRHLFLAALLAALFFCQGSRPARASDAPLTPPPGSPLRKAVLDALRQEIKRLHGLEVVFVVATLRVKDGWAWAHTRPQSPDGKNRFEDVSALLHREEGRWMVAEIPCGEMENPDCLNGPDYFDGLVRRFPAVEQEVFPRWAGQPATRSNDRQAMQTDRIRFKGDCQRRDRAVKLLDEILQDQGDFGVYGDLSVGLASILESNEVHIEANNQTLEISIYPLFGHGHDFSFVIDVDTRQLTQLVVGEGLPPPEMDD